jgi:hypothetical protein
MEQQTATETKNVIKKTIPNKQKSGIKLVMWTLSQVMEKDAMIAKIVEMFKLTDTIETIIEMVDAVEKSPEYTMMDTELTAIRSPKTKKHAKVTGDPDAIIKQLVDMATTETATGKKKKVKAPKVEGGDEDKKAEEPKKKAPRGKKAAEAADATTDVETEPKKKAPRGKKAADAADATTDVETEPKKKAPRGKKPPAAADATTDVETEPKKKAPRGKKPPAAATTNDELTEPEAPEAPKAPTTEKTPPAAAEPKAKKTPAKKTKTTVESNGTTPTGTTPTGTPPTGTTPEPIESSESAKPKTKAPKAPKTKAPSEIVHPIEVAEDLREDEYMLLNEVVVDGNTYMVDSSQNVYNEFNDVIGKYDNGVVTMNA